jgi:pimeloyl-ACP methyl ester carboxylesterase
MITYHLTGNNHHQTILFAHGLGANLSQFEEQHHYFDKNYQVLSVTLPHKFDDTLENMADNIVSLLDKLEIEKVHFVGNSMGGNIGFEVLKKYPQRLCTITTFGTTPSLKTSKIKLFIASIVIKIFPQFFIAKLGSYAGANKVSRKNIYKMLRQISKKAYLGILPSIANFDYGDVITKTKKPFCIIKADNDKEINKHLDKYINLWKNEEWCYLVNMQNAGHFANLDAPYVFNSLLEKCLSKCLKQKGFQNE